MDKEPLQEKNTSPESRVRFEQLRERTDELELLISGLALLALINLPGWLLAQYSQYVPLMSFEFLAVAHIVTPIMIAVCYLMAALLLIHLALRGYWVGLVGLKSAFPSGINWTRLRGVGRQVKSEIAGKLADIDLAIENADRRASAVFALIVYATLSLLVICAWLLLMFLISGFFGHLLGGSNFFLAKATDILIYVFVGIPLLLWLLDGLIARAFPSVSQSRLFRHSVTVLFRVERLFFPLRLVGIARYTLQSNTFPRAFSFLVIFLLLSTIWLANKFFRTHTNLDKFSTHTFIDSGALNAGHNSKNYESQLSDSDGGLIRPMIPEPLVQTDWLPIFLPYRPVSDDPILSQRCAKRSIAQTLPQNLGQIDDEAAANHRDKVKDTAAEYASNCLVKLWRITLNGKEQSLANFVVSERTDLGRRGLTGYLPLHSLTPGPQRLEVFWRPSPEQDTLNNDTLPPRTRYVIPFIWAPTSKKLTE